ncbi:MAG: T9SS C-terminal target domain-containing protein [Flavobacteriaceae bacterium]|nr:T9SS C-terminal target domain-containing protein [Flavobacteriaceae bacterium]
MKNLEEQIKKDPSLKERMIQIEKQNQEWIEKNGRGFKKHSDIESNKNSNSYSKSSLNTNDLCGYNNTYFTTITAPTTLNSIVSPSPNCTYAGEFVTVNNLIAGRTYRISTIGVDNFDTQITIYPAGGGNAVAFNDDWQTSAQSEIYFTPIFSGNYDILINEYNCITNSLCANLEVELWDIPRPVITIPVVVHVFNNGEPIGNETNISDAQIQSQIDVLNEDYRRLNYDILSTPAAFRGASSDPLIQFCLAQQKPDGTPTNGIERITIPIELQNSINRNLLETFIKPNSIWNRDKYLNIWTVNFGAPDNILLGYAQFPGGAANTDGVVIKYNVFGRVGNLDPVYNLGRTTTHEVGHWLNLKHIWGDDTTNLPNALPECSLDDDVLDTPLQSTKSYGCNTFPFYDNCTPAPLYPGIMFMNFMDYSDDNCLSLFTYGQFLRTESVMFNQRLGLLNSPGCLPGTLSSYQLNNVKILISPNPTSSKVFFDNSNTDFKEVVIYNYLGQEVTKVSFTSTSTNQEVDMSNLATGVYVLKFKNDTINQSVKIVKQ